MDCVPFLLAVLQVCKALDEEMLWDTTLKLAKTMTLECVYPLPGNVTQTEWFKVNAMKEESIAIFNPLYGVAIREPYEDRVYLLESNLTVSAVMLSFYNASEADLGFYSCHLETFPYGPWKKVIKVVPSDRFEGAVPPDSHVVSEPGVNITLTYEHRMKSPLQQVTWEKLQSHQIDLLTRCNLSQGRSYPSRYRREILSNCDQGMRRTFIIIPHVSAFDSGLYRCCFMASTGENETFVIKLTVTDGKTHHQDSQYIVFMAVGAVLSLLFVTLIAAVIAVVYNRRRQKKVQCKESENTQNQASNNYRNPYFNNQPSDGAGEDVYVNYPVFSRRPKTRS
ncbi:CD226 antigen isoform 1-T3 [Molossus nigricans]